jgi:ribonuclease P/MRP protein subunit RPP40
VLNGKESEWLIVTSGVPQGSVLGPVCFVIFINDIDEVVDLVNGFIYKFADDTKFGKTIQSDEDRAAMQNDINRLLEWAERWQMEFNKKKCKVMHFGSRNPRYSYYMGGFAPAGVVLEEVHEEKDLGVIISESLKPAAQCAKAVKKANSVLGQMSRSFHFRDRNVWIRLYKTFVRPHLELCVQAWSPWYVKDCDLLESVQKRAVNMVIGLRATNYDDKLRELKLPSLKARRTRGDMIQVWKYLHGANLGGENLLQRANVDHSRDTRHTKNLMNISRGVSHYEVRKNSFVPRCADLWNSLPLKIQDAETLLDFKKLYNAIISPY